MTSSPNHRASRNNDRTRRTPKALAWLMIAALAAFPFPWWW